MSVPETTARDWLIAMDNPDFQKGVKAERERCAKIAQEIKASAQREDSPDDIAWATIARATRAIYDESGHNGGTGSLNFRRALAAEIAIAICNEIARARREGREEMAQYVNNFCARAPLCSRSFEPCRASGALI